MVRSNKLQLLFAILCFSAFAQVNAFWGNSKKSEVKPLKEYSSLFKFSKNQKRAAVGFVALGCLVAGLVYYFLKKKQATAQQAVTTSANSTEKKVKKARK